MFEGSELFHSVLPDGVRILLFCAVHQVLNALFPMYLVICQDSLQFLWKSLDVVYIHAFEFFRIDSKLLAFFSCFFNLAFCGLQKLFRLLDGFLDFLQILLCVPLGLSFRHR